MTNKKTPSINDISIAINGLFIDITEPMSFNLNKSNFFKTYKKMYFRFNATDDLEFNINPILRFSNSRLLKEFLEREKQLSLRFQEFAGASMINNLLGEINGEDTLDIFYLNYTVEIDGDEVTVFFNTNSLIFKYEVIG